MVSSGRLVPDAGRHDGLQGVGTFNHERQVTGQQVGLVNAQVECLPPAQVEVVELNVDPPQHVRRVAVVHELLGTHHEPGGFQVGWFDDVGSHDRIVLRGVVVPCMVFHTTDRTVTICCWFTVWIDDRERLRIGTANVDTALLPSIFGALWGKNTHDGIAEFAPGLGVSADFCPPVGCHGLPVQAYRVLTVVEWAGVVKVNSLLGGLCDVGVHVQDVFTVVFFEVVNAVVVVYPVVAGSFGFGMSAAKIVHRVFVSTLLIVRFDAWPGPVTRDESVLLVPLSCGGVFVVLNGGPEQVMVDAVEVERTASVFA